MYFDPPITNENNEIENMESPQQPGCPDMLVKKGQSLALYNTKQPVSEGSNPILFKYTHKLSLKIQQKIQSKK